MNGTDAVASSIPEDPVGQLNYAMQLVGQTLLGTLIAVGTVHLLSALLVLTVARRGRPFIRIGLTAAALLIPVLGPVAAVMVLWDRIGGSPHRRQPQYVRNAKSV